MERNKRQIGAWGENIASEYLMGKGYQFVARNYNTRFGEIDLVMRDGGIIVFIEVKLRKNRTFAQAREYVTPAKQRRLRTTAVIWLNANAPDSHTRFDVVEIYAPQGTKTLNPEIIHMENAFE